MLASFNLIDSMSNYGFYHQFMMGDKSLVPMIGGAILAILVGICIMGGGKQIVRITGVLVPFMGVFYILMAVAVMFLNIGRLPEVFVNIFSNAFDFKAIFGGFAGSAMMQESRGVCIPTRRVSVLHRTRRQQLMSAIRLSRDWYRCFPSLSIQSSSVRQQR